MKWLVTGCRAVGSPATHNRRLPSVSVSFFFFFSSRRRHTRFKCDWSSDVCSSDLRATEFPNPSENHNHPCILERAANREAERPRRLEIVETPRSQHQPVQGRLDLGVVDIRKGTFKERSFAGLDETGRRNNLRTQTV